MSARDSQQPPDHSAPQAPQAPQGPQAQLERTLHRLLREQPRPCAPQDLAARVLSRIAARAALPWWRKSLVHWPLAARLLFVAAGLLSTKLAALVLSYVSAGGSRVHAALARPVADVRALAGLLTVLHALGRVAVRVVPRDWLYGGLALTAASYLALFALLAAAYSMLHTGNPGRAARS